MASLCDPGYFCPPGSTSARAHPCGSGDLFCPRGSAFPTPVDTGHYTYVENSADGGIGDFWSLTGQTVRGGMWGWGREFIVKISRKNAIGCGEDSQPIALF